MRPTTEADPPDGLWPGTIVAAGSLETAPGTMEAHLTVDLTAPRVLVRTDGYRFRWRPRTWRKVLDYAWTVEPGWTVYDYLCREIAFTDPLPDVRGLAGLAVQVGIEGRTVAYVRVVR